MVQGSGLRVQGSEFRVQSSGFRVWGGCNVVDGALPGAGVREGQLAALGEIHREQLTRLRHNLTNSTPIQKSEIPSV